MLDRLSKLILEEKNLKRLIDCNFNRDERTRLLTRLKIVQREIKETKDKLRIERMIKNERKNDFSNRPWEY